MTRLQLARLVSGVGALVAGFGLGALLPPALGAAAPMVALAGIGLHATGMWDAHRLERHADGPPSTTVTVLYGICWVLLIGSAVGVFLWR